MYDCLLLDLIRDWGFSWCFISPPMVPVLPIWVVVKPRKRNAIKFIGGILEVSPFNEALYYGKIRKREKLSPLQSLENRRKRNLATNPGLSGIWTFHSTWMMDWWVRNENTAGIDHMIDPLRLCAGFVDDPGFNPVASCLYKIVPKSYRNSDNFTDACIYFSYTLQKLWRTNVENYAHLETPDQVWKRWSKTVSREVIKATKWKQYVAIITPNPALDATAMDEGTDTLIWTIQQFNLAHVSSKVLCTGMTLTPFIFQYCKGNLFMPAVWRTCLTDRKQQQFLQSSRQTLFIRRQ